MLAPLQVAAHSFGASVGFSLIGSPLAWLLALLFLACAFLPLVAALALRGRK